MYPVDFREGSFEYKMTMFKKCTSHNRKSNAQHLAKYSVKYEIDWLIDIFSGRWAESKKTDSKNGAPFYCE